MSNIGDQFRGLDMSNLIGGPLTAAAESSVLLAKSTADFITQVGFDADNKTRTVQFKFNRSEPNPDGNMTNQEMAVEVPILAIVPIPNLQIDEVTVIFDMEVRSSERSELSVGANIGISGGAQFGPAKVSVTGSVSVNKSNTRSSDNSAKYHVNVRANNHGVPEGLARVLDMMAANVAPNLISSKPTDRNGNELLGASRQRNLRLNQLRQEALQLESAENSARDSFDLRMAKLTQGGNDLRNRIQTRLQAEITALEKEEGKDAERDKLTAKAEQNSMFWSEFRARVKAVVTANASNDPLRLLAVLMENPLGKDTPDDEKISKLEDVFKDAVVANQGLTKASNALAANRVEFNRVMIDASPAAPAESAPAAPATPVIPASSATT